MIEATHSVDGESKVVDCEIKKGEASSCDLSLAESCESSTSTDKALMPRSDLGARASSRKTQLVKGGPALCQHSCLLLDLKADTCTAECASPSRRALNCLWSRPRPTLPPEFSGVVSMLSVSSSGISRAHTGRSRSCTTAPLPERSSFVSSPITLAMGSLRSLQNNQNFRKTRSYGNRCSGTEQGCCKLAPQLFIFFCIKTKKDHTQTRPSPSHLPACPAVRPSLWIARCYRAHIIIDIRSCGCGTTKAKDPGPRSPQFQRVIASAPAFVLLF
jgi:hypothetical protein